MRRFGWQFASISSYLRPLSNNWKFHTCSSLNEFGTIIFQIYQVRRILIFRTSNSGSFVTRIMDVWKQSPRMHRPIFQLFKIWPDRTSEKEPLLYQISIAHYLSSLASGHRPQFSSSPSFFAEISSNVSIRKSSNAFNAVKSVESVFKTTCLKSDLAGSSASIHNVLRDMICAQLVHNSVNCSRRCIKVV